MMEPIKIKKIKVDKLKAVNGTFAVMGFEPPKNRKEQAQRSILSEVRKKMLKIEVGTTQLTKTVSISLKYHEADILEEWLRSWLFGEEVSYECSLISAFADELNQKLS